jgi:hypothetical protein
MDTINDSNVQIIIGELDSNVIANIDIGNVIGNINVSNLIGNVDIADVIGNVDIANVDIANVNILIDIPLGNSEVKVDIKHFDLNKTLSTFVVSNDYTKIISYPLNDNVLNLIKILVKDSPKSLEKMSNTIKDIISDGKLDMSDIPKIVLLITELNNTNLKDVFKTQNIQKSDLFDLIKFIIHLIVELKYVKVEDEKKIFEMLDMSLTLLNTNLDISSLVAMKPSWCCHQ